METFESGMRKTIEWYLENQEWADKVVEGNVNSGKRLGSVKSVTGAEK